MDSTTHVGAAGGEPGAQPASVQIAHVNSHVKRCRIVKDRLRLWQQGIRALVMGRCGTLHHFRVRLTPLTPTM